MSAIIANKPLRYEGKDYEPGQTLSPPPKGRLREQLLRGRLCVEKTAATARKTPARAPAKR